jgi:hypothetical protein
LVRRAQRAHHTVDGHLEAARLQPLLQFGFGVFGRGLHGGVDFHRIKQAVHQGLCHLVVGIQKHRANDGFQGVRQNGGTLLAA